MEDVAKEVEIQSKGVIRLGRIDWNKFADGTPNIFIHNIREIKKHEVAFLSSMHNTNIFFE